ncbi:MAG: hypothetical protein HeimC2_18160 [Candidatus Heimdallarchaeota archaeon LC_2]|nr:MAG: hypothetical protein HeimC2_18160 [Candidatus Heimdallarchaeota archaeon LC_2]
MNDNAVIEMKAVDQYPVLMVLKNKLGFADSFRYVSEDIGLRLDICVDEITYCALEM